MRKTAIVLSIAMACSIENLLETIRPGAKYIIKSGDYADLVWLDRTVKPTKAELDKAMTDCVARANAAIANPVRDKAISDAKNATLDPQARLDALIKAIDLK